MDDEEEENPEYVVSDNPGHDHVKVEDKNLCY